MAFPYQDLRRYTSPVKPSVTGPRIDVDCNVLYVDTIQSSSIHGAYDSTIVQTVVSQDHIKNDIDGM